MDHRLTREISIIAERHFAHQEITHLVEPKFIGKIIRINRIAEGFGNFFAFICPPAMREHPLWQRQTSSHEKSRPVNRMKAQDILADHVQIGGPPHLIALGITIFAICGPTGCRDIIRQRIQPDIHHMGIITGDWHAPGKAGAADRQIAQPTTHEAFHLVETGLRADKARVCLIEIKKWLLPF